VNDPQPARLAPAEVASLIDRIRLGDRSAFDMLVRRCHGLVWSIGWSAGLSRPEIEDVSQVVWLRFLEHLPTLREPAAAIGWIGTTARRESYRTTAKRRHEVGSNSDQDRTDNTPTPDDQLVSKEATGAVRVALGRLGPRCRTLFEFLLADPPLSYEFISQSMELPIGSIGPTRARCLDQLRRDPAVVALGSAGEVR
jgi:RNA polymerase sigma factor (sigma-70 family)